MVVSELSVCCTVVRTVYCHVMCCTIVRTVYISCTVVLYISTRTLNGYGRFGSTRDLREDIWQHGTFTAMSVCTTNSCKCVISIPTGADRWVSVSDPRSSSKWWQRRDSRARQFLETASKGEQTQFSKGVLNLHLLEFQCRITQIGKHISSDDSKPSNYTGLKYM
jgi:hypothetical protein